MSLGQNTVSGQQLGEYVERIEVIRKRKKECTADEAVVMAEAKAAGFVTSGIRNVLRLREMKPHVRQEAEAIRDLYLHALGMDAETPLFRQVGLMSIDVAARESVIEAAKALAPIGGSITIEAGDGKPVKITRDKEGNVTVAEVTIEPPAAPKPAGGAAGRGAAPSKPVPDVDGDGAELLGRGAFKANEPIIANPFPFGDARRPRWDAGWRKESGTDGMGPGGDD